jgi:nucleotide-binding universal stress UspA family protein
MEIVVPVDFSKGSERALEYAIGLAKTLGARIHLLHALHVPAQVRPIGTWWGTLHGQAGTSLRDWSKRIEDAGIDAEVHLADDHPVAAAIAYADKVKADYIVIGSHGQSALKHVLLGSTTDHVVRMANQPVICVPDERGADAA